MKILITGTTGFIGGEVARRLASVEGLEIIASGRSRARPSSFDPSVPYLPLNLTQDLPELRFDACIHCAGLADDRVARQELMKVNVHGTKNLLNALKGCGLFIYISSSSVYDFSKPGIKREEDTPHPVILSWYGQSKLLAENVVTTAGVRSTYILRPRAVYGSGDNVLLPRILRLVRYNRMLVPGRADCLTSLTSIQNLVSVIERCVQLKKQGVNIYNVADRDAYHLKEVLRCIAKKKNESAKLLHLPLPIVRLLSAAGSLLGVRRNITAQALGYLTRDSVLCIKKLGDQLGVTPQSEFYSSLPGIRI